MNNSNPNRGSRQLAVLVEDDGLSDMCLQAEFEVLRDYVAACKRLGQQPSEHSRRTAERLKRRLDDRGGAWWE